MVGSSKWMVLVGDTSMLMRARAATKLDLDLAKILREKSIDLE